MKQKSLIHNHFGPRQVKPLVINGVDVTEAFIADMSSAGVVLDSASMEKMHNYLYQGQGIAHGVGMDSDMVAPITSGSVSTPIQFAQSWLPGVVRIVTSPRKIDNLIGITTQGDWADEQIVQSLVGNSGEAGIYTDDGNVNLANWNLNFVTRTIVRGEIGFTVGRLEQERGAKVRISSADEKRYGVIEALEIFRNNVGFSGFNNGDNNTYGLLNDPQLLAYNALPTGDWPNATYLEIVDDIIFMAATLQTQSDGRVDPKTDQVVFAIPVETDQYLNTSTEFGNTSVRRWIKETYPNWRVETVPQFEAANAGQNVAYLYTETVDMSGTDNSRTFVQVVPTKFRTLGVEQRSKSYLEDFSNATAGALCKRPYAVARFFGI